MASPKGTFPKNTMKALKLSIRQSLSRTNLRLLGSISWLMALDEVVFGANWKQFKKQFSKAEKNNSISLLTDAAWPYQLLLFSVLFQIYNIKIISHEGMWTITLTAAQMGNAAGIYLKAKSAIGVTTQSTIINLNSSVLVVRCWVSKENVRGSRYDIHR